MFYNEARTKVEEANDYLQNFNWHKSVYMSICIFYLFGIHVCWPLLKWLNIFVSNPWENSIRVAANTKTCNDTDAFQ